jgi:hypothetical protein
MMARGRYGTSMIVERDPLRKRRPSRRERMAADARLQARRVSEHTRQSREGQRVAAGVSLRDVHGRTAAEVLAEIREMRPTRMELRFASGSRLRLWSSLP